MGILVSTSVALALLASDGGDAKGQRNIADKSKLPRGDGLAAAHVADRGVGGHAAVIFADDFERGDWKDKWDSNRNKNDAVLSLVDESKSSRVVGRKSLRARAVLGENTGGGLTKWFDPPDTVFIRFYVKFDRDCDYVHHMCQLRGNKGLRGGDRWSGFGGAGNKPRGDERFSTGMEPWGASGRRSPPGAWNFYSYWHTMKKSGDGKYWGNAFRPARQTDVPRDRWISVEFMLKHNTPGKDDGEQAYWIDGELRGHWKGINWRKTEGLRANAFTLESYVTDRWTKNEVNIVYFDNVVIAKEYIGPAKTRK